MMEKGGLEERLLVSPRLGSRSLSLHLLCQLPHPHAHTPTLFPLHAGVFISLPFSILWSLKFRHLSAAERGGGVAELRTCGGGGRNCKNMLNITPAI